MSEKIMRRVEMKEFFLSPPYVWSYLILSNKHTYKSWSIHSVGGIVLYVVLYFFPLLTLHWQLLDSYTSNNITAQRYSRQSYKRTVISKEKGILTLINISTLPCVYINWSCCSLCRLLRERTDGNLALYFVFINHI